MLIAIAGTVHAPCDFYKILALKEVIVELCGSSVASLVTLSAGLPPALPFDDLRVFILLAVFSPKMSNALRDPYNANFGKQFVILRLMPYMEHLTNLEVLV